MYVILIFLGIIFLIISLGLSTMPLSIAEQFMFFGVACIMFFMARAYKMIEVIFNKEVHKDEEEETL